LDTTTLARGSYQLSATITINGAENVTSNNYKLYGPVQVRQAGDVNGDGVVNGLDLGPLGAAFLSTPRSPNWNPAADINNDSVVNGLDLGIIGANFLKK
jgi:hypothetical protein